MRLSPIALSVLMGSMACFSGNAALAHTSPSSSGRNGVDAALDACASQVQKDSHGGPDQSDMQSCMKAKGFTRPSGNGPPPGPPPGNN